MNHYSALPLQNTFHTKEESDLEGIADKRVEACLIYHRTSSKRSWTKTHRGRRGRRRQRGEAVLRSSRAQRRRRTVGHKSVTAAGERIDSQFRATSGDWDGTVGHKPVKG